MSQQSILDLLAAMSPAAARVLKELVQVQDRPIHPTSLLAALIRIGHGKVNDLLQRSIRGTAGLEGLLSSIATLNSLGVVASAQAGPTSTTMAALQEFEAVRRDGGERFQGIELELLVACLLNHLSDEERAHLPELDFRRAQQVFRQFIANRVARPEPTPDGVPFRLPLNLVASEDLTWQAKQATTAMTYPFDGEPRFEAVFDAIARVLHRRTCNHVLLVGERGVGKSTLVAEFARRAAEGQMLFLKDKRFLSVSCRYVAAEESRARLLAILTEVSGHPDLVVCFDGFATLMRGIGTSNRSALLSSLSQARCQVMGLLTPTEFEELVAGDEDFLEFFTRVDVEEPDTELALKLMNHYAEGLAQKFEISIDKEAVRQAVVLSSNYILNDQLPAKALKILHRVCEDIDYERSQLAKSRNRVTSDEMVKAVSALSGVPEETLRGIAECSDYERSLGEVIFGQDHAVREVAAELGLIKAGMTDANKPASVMMFVGQTGTGKTEMAKALARFYSTSKRLKTYTLGNFVEPHSVAGIIGVPPGYVGTDKGGRLVNDLNADPYGVYLLDEADKAHPDVMQPFLNLFDEGWIVDQRGTKAFANKSMFILTTNVGQKMIADMARKGQTVEEITERMKETLTQIKHTKSNRPVFSPEFLARIKRIIVFQPLDGGAMDRIAHKLIAELQRTWTEKRGKALMIPDAFVDALARIAHLRNERSKGKEGGRVVRKMIAETLEVVLQRQIAVHPEEYRAARAIAIRWNGGQATTSPTALQADLTVDFSMD